MFEIIVTLFTSNTDADQQRSAELLARISKFMNALSTTGNLAGAHIDVQVEFINDLLFNLFQIPKPLPFRGLKEPVHTLQQTFWDTVTSTLEYSSTAIQAITNQALLYPAKAKSNSSLIQFLPFRRSRKRKQIRMLLLPRKRRLLLATIKLPLLLSLNLWYQF